MRSVIDRISSEQLLLAAPADWSRTESPTLSYGDFPVREFFVHTPIYRAFQAWSIAKLLGIEVPADADRETALLARTGYWVP